MIEIHISCVRVLRAVMKCESNQFGLLLSQSAHSSDSIRPLQLSYHIEMDSRIDIEEAERTAADDESIFFIESECNRRIVPHRCQRLRIEEYVVVSFLWLFLLMVRHALTLGWRHRAPRPTEAHSNVVP